MLPLRRPLYLPSADFRTPDTLVEVLRYWGVPARRVRVAGMEPIVPSLSCARLVRLRLHVASPRADVEWQTSLVLKELVPLGGWLSWASEDAILREAQLWRSGVLEDLPATIATGALAVSLTGAVDAPTGGALLMRDMRSFLLPHPLRTPPPASLTPLLDDLARMHARFWDDARLGAVPVGLASPRAALLMAAPATVADRIAMCDTDPYLASMPQGWESFFSLAAPEAADTLRHVLAEPEPIIHALDHLPATLVHGDVWGPNLGRLPAARTAGGTRVSPRTLLLDWALATTGPCVYDPLWLAGTWHALDHRRLLAVYRSQLTHQLGRHGRALDQATWCALVDAGYLRTALVCGEAFGRVAAQAPQGSARLRAERRARWWASRAAQAAGRLIRLAEE